MKTESIVAFAVLGLAAYLLYLFFTQQSNALGGPGNAGTVFNAPGGATSVDCTAQICAGTPLDL